MNLANKLTVMRIFIIPFFIIGFYNDRTVCVVLFSLAAITDLLDGFVARKLSIESDLGRFIDPVADKFLVVSALFLIASSYQSPWITIAAIIIISRELAISSFREWLSTLHHSKLPVSFLGKLKTTTQLIAIIFLLYTERLESTSGTFGLWLLWLATLLAVWSFFSYLWDNRAIFSDH